MCVRACVCVCVCVCVCQWSLWGNKTDLSLLVDASGLNPVSSASATHTNSDGTLHPTNPHVIVDEYGAVWARLSRDLGSQGPGRIDIVLDNSGRLDMSIDVLTVMQPRECGMIALPGRATCHVPCMRLDRCGGMCSPPLPTSMACVCVCVCVCVGLELYGDLILADFLITQGLAKQVCL